MLDIRIGKRETFGKGKQAREKETPAQVRGISFRRKAERERETAMQ